MLSQAKLKEQAQIHSDLNNGLGTSQHQSSVAFLSLISPFHLPLALSGSILPYLPLSWPIPQHPHHPHQKPSLSPSITNVVVTQSQVCQGRVVLQSFCQCLTADKDLQTTWWHYVKSGYKGPQRVLPHSSQTSSGARLWSHIKWREQTQIQPDLNDRLSTWPVPHPPSPSSPNTKPEPLQGQCCSATNPGLSGSSSASVLLPKPHRRKISANYVVKSSKILWNSHKRNLNTFYRILLILPLILTYHVVSNEMKRTSSNSLRPAWWTRHISPPIV